MKDRSLLVLNARDENQQHFFKEMVDYSGVHSVTVEMLDGSIRSRTYVPLAKSRRSASLIHDGRDYYQKYDPPYDDDEGT